MFNANILERNEGEVSLAGNGRYGVTEGLELGSQGLFLLTGIPNLSTKYEMFKERSYTTAFNAHLFHVKSNLGAKAEKDGDSSSADGAEQSGSMAATFGYFGAMTTLRMDQRDYLSFGVYDIFMRQTAEVMHEKLSMHSVSPTIGYDKYLSPHLAMTAGLSYPAFIFVSAMSDAADASGVINLLDLGKSNIQSPSLGFLTFTYSSGNLNLEGGLMGLGGRGLPYGNIFWRFR
jgi:hypothetical protein